MCHPSGSLQSWSVLGNECLAPNKSPGHQVSNEFLPKPCGAPCVLPVCGWEVKHVPSDSPARGIRSVCSLCLGFPQAFLPFADIASGPFVVNHSKTQLHDRRVNLTVLTDLSPAGRCYHTIIWFCFFIHFSLCGVHVCVCILHMWGVRWTYVHRRKRKPKVVSGIILSVSSTLLNEAGFLNQTQSSLICLALLINFSGNPFSTLWCWNDRQAPTSAKHLHRFLGIRTLILTFVLIAAWALTAEPFSWALFITLKFSIAHVFK